MYGARNSMKRVACSRHKFYQLASLPHPPSPVMCKPPLLTPPKTSALAIVVPCATERKCQDFDRSQLSFLQSLYLLIIPSTYKPWTRRPGCSCVFASHNSQRREAVVIYETFLFLRGVRRWVRVLWLLVVGWSLAHKLILQNSVFEKTHVFYMVTCL